MPRLLGVAFRNLLRARRRNALAGGTMVLGSAALVLDVFRPQRRGSSRKGATRR